ncbi:DUF4065 domain-containing protein [Candidatus Saccharibacteria bacterium]|nr:DUF4065 domain-containing protein [Candidatus Saccharibacteria bacterium]
MGIGSNLKSLRDASDLSQEDAARALNMTRPAYKQLEDGIRDPSMSELNAISELFGERVETLTGTSSGMRKIIPNDKIADGVNKIKYKNVILYLAREVGARPNVGETVFYKLIYFIETLALKRNGAGIVGEQFWKRQYGPVPVSFQAITNEMIRGNELDCVRGIYFTYMQTKYLPRVEVNGLSQDDKIMIDIIIEKLGHESATSLSNLSHEDAPWIEATDDGIINLELISKTNGAASVRMGRI